METAEKPKKRAKPEPVGIVISGGPVDDRPPLFAAYVWGPAPEQTRTSPEPRVA